MSLCYTLSKSRCLNVPIIERKRVSWSWRVRRSTSTALRTSEYVDGTASRTSDLWSSQLYLQRSFSLLLKAKICTLRVSRINRGSNYNRHSKSALMSYSRRKLFRSLKCHKNRCGSSPTTILSTASSAYLRSNIANLTKKSPDQTPNALLLSKAHWMML